MMYVIGLESVRCYLESTIVTERAIWALSLQCENNKKDEIVSLNIACSSDQSPFSRSQPTNSRDEKKE